MRVFLGKYWEQNLAKKCKKLEIFKMTIRFKISDHKWIYFYVDIQIITIHTLENNEYLFDPNSGKKDQYMTFTQFY